MADEKSKIVTDATGPDAGLPMWVSMWAMA